MNLKTKNITKKILSCTLSILIIMTTLSFPVSAAAAPFSIDVATPEVNGKTVTVSGELSDGGERLVSIFVLPEKINGELMDSVDDMLALRSTDAVALYQNVEYLNSASSDADGSFTFTFRVKSEGYYYIFIDAQGAAEFTPVRAWVKGIVDFLAEAGTEEAFKKLLIDNVGDTGASQTTLDTIALFSEEKKAELAQYVYDNRPSGLAYADKASLAAKIEAGTATVVAGVVNDLKTVASEDAIMDIIEDNAKLIDVEEKLVIYNETLDDTRKASVKTALYAEAASFTQLSDCKTCFENAVTAAANAMETEILGALNGATTAEDFGAKLLLYKDIIGLTDEQTELLERLSTTMCNNLYGKMMDDPDFDEYSDVPASFNTAKTEIGESAIALDIINNKEKSSATIVEILYEHEALLAGLNKADYEQLKDGENVYYQNQVKEKLLAGMPYATLEAVKTTFNTLVAEQKSAKETVTTLITADYDTIQTIIANTHAELGISETDYADYQYIAGASAAKFTDLINNLLKYKEQYTDAGKFVTIFAREVAAVKATIPTTDEGTNDDPLDDGNKGSGGGGGGGGSNRVIGSKVEEAPKEEETGKFTDLGSVSWAKEQILFLADKGIVNGKGDKIFDPNGNVTREEFVKMLVCAFEIHNSDAVSDFTDCTGGAWYDSYVASAADKGIVMGSDNGSFGIGQNITREDMSVLVYRVLKTEKGFSASQTVEAFADQESISDYAVEGIYALKNAGYVNGMGNNMFNPKNFCTRAEAAVIIYNVIK